MASFAGLLPLRCPSQLDDPKVRQRVISLTEGVTGRIFRLMEAVGIAAIRSGREMVDADCCTGTSKSASCGYVRQ